MAAYGVPQYDISLVLGISPKTLRKHFFQEIEVAGIEANAKVAETLFNTATKGTGKEAIVAAIFWLKCRAGWRDRDPVVDVLGKKEQIAQAVRTVGENTEWGDDLAGPASLN